MPSVGAISASMTDRSGAATTALLRCRVVGDGWAPAVLSSDGEGEFGDDIPGLYLSSRDLLIFVDVGRSGDGLVVTGAGLQAAMQNAHQAVGQLAQGGMVTEASAALLVVVGTGAG